MLFETSIKGKRADGNRNEFNDLRAERVELSLKNSSVFLWKCGTEIPLESL